MLEYNWTSHDVSKNHLANEVVAEMTQMSIPEFSEKH